MNDNDIESFYWWLKKKHCEEKKSWSEWNGERFEFHWQHWKCSIIWAMYS